MSSAADITPEVRIEAVGSFLQEYIDAAANTAIAETTNPALNIAQATAVANAHEAALDRLHSFFVAWAENQ